MTFDSPNSRNEPLKLRIAMECIATQNNNAHKFWMKTQWKCVCLEKLKTTFAFSNILLQNVTEKCCACSFDPGSNWCDSKSMFYFSLLLKTRRCSRRPRMWTIFMAFAIFAIDWHCSSRPRRSLILTLRRSLLHPATPGCQHWLCKRYHCTAHTDTHIHTNEQKAFGRTMVKTRNYVIIISHFLVYWFSLDC